MVKFSQKNGYCRHVTLIIIKFESQTRKYWFSSMETFHLFFIFLKNFINFIFNFIFYKENVGTTKENLHFLGWNIKKITEIFSWNFFTENFFKKISIFPPRKIRPNNWINKWTNFFACFLSKFPNINIIWC